MRRKQFVFGFLFLAVLLSATTVCADQPAASNTGDIGQISPPAVAALTDISAKLDQLTAQVQTLAARVQDLQLQLEVLRAGQGVATANMPPPAFLQAGLTEDQVRALLGSPTAITKYPSLGDEMWWYGTSSSPSAGSFVLIAKGRVSDWHESFSGRSLKAHPSIGIAPSQSAPAVTAPGVAENGTYYGETSDATGRPKTVHVNGYYRADGTYVRGHYRSAPRR